MTQTEHDIPKRQDRSNPDKPAPEEKTTVLAEIDSLDKSSVMAMAGHPLHAATVHFPIVLAFITLSADLCLWVVADPFWQRAGLWAAGLGFVSGVVAGLIGLMELLLVRGIRSRSTGWAHGVAAIMLIAVLGANWGLRIQYPDRVLPDGLFLSVLAAILTVIAGWHGGKLIFHYGIGLKAAEEGD